MAGRIDLHVSWIKSIVAKTFDREAAKQKVAQLFGVNADFALAA